MNLEDISVRKVFEGFFLFIRKNKDLGINIVIASIVISNLSIMALSSYKSSSVIADRIVDIVITIL